MDLLSSFSRKLGFCRIIPFKAQSDSDPLDPYPVPFDVAPRLGVNTFARDPELRGACSGSLSRYRRSSRHRTIHVVKMRPSSQHQSIRWSVTLWELVT